MASKATRPAGLFIAQKSFKNRKMTLYKLRYCGILRSRVKEDSMKHTVTHFGKKGNTHLFEIGRINVWLHTRPFCVYVCMKAI
jgi:hypothetical protein